MGSALTAYSDRCFVDRSRLEGVPVALVNAGPTRADEVAAVQVEGWVGRSLPTLVDALP